MSDVDDAALRTILGVREVKAVKPFNEFFCAEFVSSLCEDILTFVGKFRERALEDLIMNLYIVAHAMAEMENLLGIERKSPAFFRKWRARYNRVLVCVNQSFRSLLEAEKLLGEWGIRPQRFNFRGPLKHVMTLHQSIAKAEAQCAAMIHPDLRTKVEKQLAKGYVEIPHPHFRTTEGSAQLQYEVTRVVEKEVVKFSRGKVPSNHIDRFISKFFAAALGMSGVSEENVKTMRSRLKRKKTERKPTNESRDSPEPLHQNG
jgi:hypothetical protein